MLRKKINRSKTMEITRPQLMRVISSLTFTQLNFVCAKLKHRTIIYHFAIYWIRTFFRCRYLILFNIIKLIICA